MKRVEILDNNLNKLGIGYVQFRDFKSLATAATRVNGHKVSFKIVRGREEFIEVANCMSSQFSLADYLMVLGDAGVLVRNIDSYIGVDSHVSLETQQDLIEAYYWKSPDQSILLIDKCKVEIVDEEFMSFSYDNVSYVMGVYKPLKNGKR